jgi:hypothetical protein
MSRDATGGVETLLAWDSFGGPLPARTSARSVTSICGSERVTVETRLPGGSDGTVLLTAPAGKASGLLSSLWGSSVRLAPAMSR